jgi:murein DD-endopeptidase MepM/ murein hydrolase activator NlpD
MYQPRHRRTVRRHTWGRRAAQSALGGLVLVVGLATVANAHTNYTVRPGDTLSEIAAANGTTWQQVYELNKDIIDDPNLIFPDQVLVTSLEGSEPARSGSKADRSGGSRQQVDSIAAARGGITRPATGSVTSHYGYRTHPITGVYKLHTGTDFSYGNGNAYAAAAGRVSIEHPEWAGNLVIVDHGGGVQTRYAHLASVSVSSGQQVDSGDVVGRIGERGLATGPHLHFEVLLSGDFSDPLAWLGG